MEQNNMLWTGAIKNNSSSRENDLGRIHTRNSVRNSTPNSTGSTFFIPLMYFKKKTYCETLLIKHHFRLVGFHSFIPLGKSSRATLLY